MSAGIVQRLLHSDLSLKVSVQISLTSSSSQISSSTMRGLSFVRPSTQGSHFWLFSLICGRESRMSFTISSSRQFSPVLASQWSDSQYCCSSAYSYQGDREALKMGIFLNQTELNILTINFPSSFSLHSTFGLAATSWETIRTLSLNML